MAISIKNNPLPGILDISSHYGHRDKPNVKGATSNHKGTDFRASQGTPIYAVDSGSVVISKIDVDGYGNYVVIKHSGYFTLYAHMVKPGISSGRSVSAGQIVGYVGSTGASTGPHLHFEIREGTGSFWDATPRNPIYYLDVPNAYIPLVGNIGDTLSDDFSEEGSPSLANIVYETEVLPERVANSGTQPFSTFVELYVSQERITFLPPKNVINLEVSRLKADANTYSLTVFDDDWDTLEGIFAHHSGSIQLRYGFVNGLTSRTYNLKVTDYTINFNSAGTMLTIKGTSEGVLDNLVAMNLDTGVLNPTEAAKIICREAGWQVIDENFEPSRDVEFSHKDSITLAQDYPATYIKMHLAPLAVRLSDGESGFTFYLDDTTSPPTAHFRAHTLKSAANKTYIYMKGLDSPIIDLQLTVGGVFGGSVGEGEGFTSLTTGMEASFIDPDTKEIITLSEDIDSVKVTAAGEYSHTNKDQHKSIVDASGASQSQMNAVLNYRLKSGFPYEGIITLVGDPEHDVGDVIRLMIVTDKGNLHHSSGLYLVKGVIDSISNGIMTTSLTIHRSEDIEAGIEITNYRNLIK